MPQDPETRIKVRAKVQLVLNGVEYQPGNVIELPEREALGLIGIGDAEEIPAGADTKSEAGTAEQVAEATHKTGEPEHPDAQKAKQLEQQVPPQSGQPPKRKPR